MKLQHLFFIVLLVACSIFSVIIIEPILYRSAIEKDIVENINLLRKEKGVRPLYTDKTIAMFRAEDLVKNFPKTPEVFNNRVKGINAHDALVDYLFIEMYTVATRGVDGVMIRLTSDEKLYRFLTDKDLEFITVAIEPGVIEGKEVIFAVVIVGTSIPGYIPGGSWELLQNY